MATQIPVPPSTNNLWRQVRRYRKGTRKQYTALARTDAYEAWLAAAVYTLKSSMEVVKRYPIGIRITIVGGQGFDGRKRDLDNCAKAVQDAMRHAGRIEDDTCECVDRMELRYQPGPLDRPAECWVEIAETDTNKAHTT